MVDYSKKLIHGTLIVLIFSIVSLLFGYLLKYIFAQRLEVSEIGLFFSVLGFISFFIFFRDLGLADALVYFIPTFLVEKSKKNIKNSIILTLLVQLFFGILFFVLMLFISPYLSKYYFKEARATQLILFLSLYFIVDGLHETLAKTFQGFQKIFFQQALDFSFQFISSIFILFIIFFKKDITLFGLVYIIADFFVVSVFYIVFIKKVFSDFYKVKIKKDSKLVKKLLDYALPTMTWTLAEVGFSQQTVFFLTLFSGLESVGYYVMIRAIAKLSIFVYKSSSRVFSPMISELWKKGKISELNFLFKEQLTFIYLLALPIIFGIVFFSDIILRLLYGEKFVIASFALKIAALYFLFDIINSNLNSISQSVGYPKLPRNNAYLKFFSNVIFNLLLIPRLGLVGAVFADLIAIFLATIWAMYFNIKKINISFPIKKIILLLFSSFFYVLSISLFRVFFKQLKMNPYLELFSILIFSGIIYLFFLFLLKLIDVKKVINLIKKGTNDKIDFSFLNKD